MSSYAGRSAVAAATFAVLVLAASRGHATEPEAIRLRVDDPPGCALREDFVAQIEALGGRLRTPREEERARELDVTIRREDGRLAVRLVVHDLVGRVTERHVQSSDCTAATKAASLLVALALDEPEPERRPVEEPAPVAPARTFWPAPARDDGGTTGMRVVRAGRLGSGGLLLTGSYGATLQEGSFATVQGESLATLHAGSFATLRALAMARVVSTTRLGGGVTLSRDLRDIGVDGVEYRTAGWSGRIGGTFGWGAPWDDSVAGFVGELGVAAGEQHGVASFWTPGSRQRSCAGGCYRAHATSSRWVSPFVSWSLLFQVPEKAWRVRPVAGLTASWVPYEARGATLGCDLTLGLVWQAW